MELKLYEAPQLMEQIVNLVDEDWCLTDEAIQKLDELELAIEEKAKGIWFITRRLDWYTDIIDAEIKRLQNLKKSYKSNVDRLKDYLGINLHKLWKDKVETDLFKFSFRESKSVDVIDEEKIPKDYMKEEVKISVDKIKILKELKEWKEIPWVALKVNSNLQIK